MRRLALLLALGAAAAASVAGGPPPAAAAVPGTLRFEGRLIDPATLDPRGEASVSLNARVYDAASGGTLLWSESGVTAALDDGRFSVLLGASVPLSSAVFSADGRWLEVEAAGVTLSPRSRLPSAPWALRAAAADSLEPGAANYLNNRSDLQAGAEFYAASASVSGPLTAYGTVWALSALEVRGVVRTGTGLHQITTAAGLLDAAKADPATLVPNAALDASSVTKLGPAADVPGGLAVLDAAGFVPAARLASNVTRQGNAFNAANKLLELDAAALVLNALIDVSSAAKLSAGKIPSGLLDPSSVTLLGNTLNAADGLSRLGGGGFVPNAQVDPSSVVKLSAAGRVHNYLLDAASVTLAGNAFNGANQLVRFDASGTLSVGGSPGYSVVTSSSVDLAAGKVRENGADLVPKDMLILWLGAACPPGWAEETALRGRTPLGTCSGCTDGVTQGTAFTADAQSLTHTHGQGATTTAGLRINAANSLVDTADTTMPYIQVLFCRKT